MDPHGQSRATRIILTPGFPVEHEGYQLVTAYWFRRVAANLEPEEPALGLEFPEMGRPEMASWKQAGESFERPGAAARRTPGKRARPDNYPSHIPHTSSSSSLAQ
jgi:hypothetical protein